MAEQRVQRRLAAILAADVVGYSRMMREDEEGTLRTLTDYRDVIDGLIGRHDGRVFSTGGDSVLAEFGSVVEAVRCAISVQEEISIRNAELPDDRALRFRIGINVGDVMVKDDDLFGDGVNVAARLEGLSEPGGICISASVFEQIKHKLSLGFEDLGPQDVKNISEPVSAFRIVHGSVSVEGGEARVVAPSIRMIRWKAPTIVALAVLGVVVGGASFWQTFFPRVPVDRPVEPASDAMAPNPSASKNATPAAGPGNLAGVPPGQQVRPRATHVVKGEALDLFTRAKGLDLSARANLDAARQMFERAVDLDPRFAGGYAGLSRAHSLAIKHGFSASPREDIKKAFQLAERAVAMDATAGWSHGALASAYLVDGQHDQAIRSAEKAAQLQPNDADAHANLAMALMFAGRSEDAIVPVRKAVSLNPRLIAFSTGPHLNYSGFVYFSAGWYEEAIAAFKENRSQGGPIGLESLAYAAAAYSLLNRREEAGATARELLAEHPGFSIGRWAWLRLFKNPADSNRLSNALKKAGVPK